MGFDKNNLYSLEILKHVEGTPILSNRMAASKLGCSVKLAHELLSKMVGKGYLHVKKRHSRRWDYFLTPKGITEKARLTYEFINFSMQFYREARKRSSQLCKDLAVKGKRKIALVGSGDLAEIVYLGVREWKLELVEVFDDTKNEFLSIKTQPLKSLDHSKADAIIVCIYDKARPMNKFLLNTESDRFYHVF